MQLPFFPHVGIRAVMLNISGLSLAIKRGQVCVKKKNAVTGRPTGYPELLSGLCCACAAQEILPFHTAYTCPPASAGAPSGAAQSSAKTKQLC